MKKLTLKPAGLKPLREMDPRLLSYNVEMTEVTGGTFWKPYTREQIEGTEAFPPIRDWTELATLMAVYPPIDLYNSKLRTLAKALGPVYMRVSGSWASSTYYDFDGHTGGKVPEGFQSVLTEAQWKGVLDFAREVGAELLVSMANSDGVHGADGAWQPGQAALLFDYSRDYGFPIYASEFMNEPNVAHLGGAPKGYTPADFGRDQDLFFRFLRENHPDVKLVGPCATGDSGLMDMMDGGGGAFPNINAPSSRELLGHCKEKADIFSYHMYHGISERGAVMGGHWQAEDATTDAYLAVAANAARFYAPLRDEFCPGAPMWVTESADAGCGGNTWGSTFLDVLRFANELGSFCTVTDGAIFHNTLASSDYGLLDHSTFAPRPNYWLALLWNRLMGTTVYDTGAPGTEGAHLYAHSRRDGREGACYLLVNNSLTESTGLALPGAAACYVLSAQALRSRQVLLNGKPLVFEDGQALPELAPVAVDGGALEVPPCSVAFVVV